MTDKHIPASKLLALPQHNDSNPLYENGGDYILYDDLRALIDEAQDSVAMTSDEDCPCCGKGKLVYTYCNSCGTGLAHPRKAEQDDEAVAYGIPHDENNNTFAYELLAMELAAEEHDDIHQLVYEGYPPEPWGEVWQRYEADAKKMIERVQKHTRHAQKTCTESDIDEAIGAVDWANTSWQQAAVEAKKLVIRFVGSQVTMEVKRLSEEEVAEIMDNNGAGWWTKHNHEFDYHSIANALMNKMTGGGK